MVKAATTRAVSLIEAGMLFHEGAKVVGVSVRTIRRWLLRSKAGESTEQEGPWKENGRHYGTQSGNCQDNR